jgi:hypothetical protein
MSWKKGPKMHQITSEKFPSLSAAEICRGMLQKKGWECGPLYEHIHKFKTHYGFHAKKDFAVRLEPEEPKTNDIWDKFKEKKPERRKRRETSEIIDEWIEAEGQKSSDGSSSGPS